MIRSDNLVLEDFDVNFEFILKYTDVELNNENHRNMTFS